jgi:hypothetical protein
MFATMITTPESYKANPTAYTAKPFNFRGNPDNKTLISQLTQTYGFANEGQALDYVCKVFAEAITQPQATDTETLNTTIQQLSKQLQAVEAEKTALTAELEALKAQPATAEITAEEFLSTFKLFEHPQLFWLKAWHKEGEDNNALDTLNYYKQQMDYEKFLSLTQPLQLLQGEEYEALLKWDREVFTPAIQAITGRPDLILTARHKFLLMLDYCAADPVAEVFKIVPLLSAQQKEAVENLQFPRPDIMQQILAEIDEIRAKAEAEIENNTETEETTENDNDDTTTLVEEETENGPTPGNNPGSTNTGGNETGEQSTGNPTATTTSQG